MAEDIFAEAESIKRRKMLLDALATQSRTAPIVGNTGIGQLLAKLGTTYITNSGQKDVEGEQAANQGRYQQELAGQLEGFMKRREGAPGGTLSDKQAADLLLNDVDPGMQAAPVKADPKGAVFAAIASRFPEMQAVGQAGLKDMLALDKKGGDYKEHLTQDGTLVRTYADGRVQNMGNFAKPQEKWGELETLDVGGKPIKAQKNLTTGKYHEVGTGNVVTVSTGDNDATKDLIKNSLPGGKGYDKAYAAGEAVQLANEQLAAIAQGAQSGSLGNVQQEARKFFELLGVPNAGTAPTEMLGTIAKQRVLAKAGGSLGAQISNSDRDFLSQAQGDLTTNPEAFKRLLAISIASDMKAIQKHNQSVGVLGENMKNPALAQTGRIDLNVTLADPQVADMVERVLQGKPSVDPIKGATSANPTGAPVKKGTAQNPLSVQDLSPEQKAQLMQMLQGR